MVWFELGSLGVELEKRLLPEPPSINQVVDPTHRKLRDRLYLRR